MLAVNCVCKNCVVTIEGVDMYVDLLPLESQEFDVTLGMDFLFKYHAHMDCHRKEVVFRKPSELEVGFKGGRKQLPIGIIS